MPRSHFLSALVIGGLLAAIAFPALPVEAAAVPIPVGNTPDGVAYDAANGNVYVSNYVSQSVSVIDGSTDTVTATITVGQYPMGVAVDPVNGDVYVANYGANMVSVINPSKKTVISTVPVGPGPQAVAADPTNGDVYVANSNYTYTTNPPSLSGPGTVSVINGQTNQVTHTIPVGQEPRGMAYDAANGNLYVSNTYADTVSVINPRTNQVSSTLTSTTFHGPIGVAYDAANTNIYVANNNSTLLSVINPSTSQVSTIPAGGTFPYAIGVDAGTGALYVADQASPLVAVIQPGNTNPVTSTFSVPNAPFGVAYDPANGDMYVTGGVLTVIGPYTVSYRGNGNTGGAAPTDAMVYGKGATVPVLGAGTLAKTGYTFAGWNTQPNGSGTAYYPDTTPLILGTASLTLYALWTPTPSHVIYNGNGNTGGAAPTDAATYAPGALATIAGPGTLTKTGLIFSGWNTAPNGSGTAYAANSTLTLGAANVTLYAQWATPPVRVRPAWSPPVLNPESVSVGGVTTDVIGTLGYNLDLPIDHGSYRGYVEERAAVEAGARFAGEGLDSAYLSAIMDGSGVGLQQHVSAVQQGQFAALYQKLGIIPTWTDNTVHIAAGVKALETAGAAPLAIENYLVQLDGFSWTAAQAQAAAGFPLQSGA